MTTPLGYVTDERPQNSKKSFRDFRVLDRGISIAKAALQTYFQSFLSPEGVNRAYFDATVSPAGLQFVTNLSYDDEMKADPNKRKTYLARYFAENVGRLPAILIIDTGVTYEDQGVNDLVGASTLNGRWQGKFLFYIKINLSVTSTTLSEEDTSTLASMIVTMIGPMANAINNYVLTEYGQSWELRLPIANVAISQATSTQLGDSTSSQIWMRSVDFTVDFEASVGMSLEMQDIVPPERAFIGINNPGDPVPRFLNIQPNAKLPLGYPQPVMIDYMRLNYKLATSDPNVALVSSEPPYLIQPRSPGRCLLLVLDQSKGDLGVTPLNPRSNRLVVDLPFEVVI